MRVDVLGCGCPYVICIRIVSIGLLSVALCSCDRTHQPDRSRDTSAAEPLTRAAKAEGDTDTDTDTDTNQSLNLVDITTASGIGFVHSYDGRSERIIVEEIASGMATIDYDNDGLIDAFFLNGSSIPRDENIQPSNALFRNQGDMRFSEVTIASHTSDREMSLGVAVADFDNDGFGDLYINNYGNDGPNQLLRNNGDGTFSDVTAPAGVRCGQHTGAGVCFLDADRDGDLDLYVANYVDSPVEKNVKRTTEGFPSYPGPLEFERRADIFFRNLGDGRFSDASVEFGISEIATPSMGIVAADYDDDGDTDVFVANDVERNVLLNNDGNGKFTDVGILSGVAFSHDGRRNGNMGVDCADYNGDGALDFFVTTFSNEMPVLYKNDGAGYFTDVTNESGAGSTTLPHANWGASFFDVENDGDRDLLIANGHTDPNVALWAYTTSWKVANSLFLNDGSGRFEDVSIRSGSGLKPVECSRGLVTDDFDNDGDVDAIVLNALAAPTVMRNDSQPRFNWLQIELRGKSTCRDASGTKVIVEVAGKRLVDEVHNGRGYQSSYGQRLYFGLGDAKVVSKVSVRWLGGSMQTVVDVRANQLLTILEE